MKEEMVLYDEDYCDECGGYGDDYYIDEEGDFVCRCPECPYRKEYDDETD